MRKYVLTGSACCGKTGVIEELKNRGYLVVEETARPVLQERVNFKPTKKEIAKRQKLIFYMQLEEEKKAENIRGEILFLDRSLIDVIAYSLYYLKKIPGYINNYKLLREYDNIFILERYPFINDGVRVEKTEAVAKAIHKKIVKVYGDFGYNLIKVPIMGNKDRVEFILKNLEGKLDPYHLAAKITENYLIGENGLH